MPLLSVSAIDWSYQVDLTQGPGTFSANFLDVEGFRATESIYNNAASADRIQIYVLVQGNSDLLGEFVVDEYSATEGPDGVTSRLAGRDSKALLLELFPATSTTYQGMTVSSDCTITYHQTAVGALTDIIQRAGYTPSVNIDNYQLGQDFVHGTNTSFGEAITQLLEPQRQTGGEKYWGDVYLQGTTIWVWQRNLGAPFGSVNVRHQDLIERNIEKQRPALTSSIQVLGHQYSCFESALVIPTSSEPITGWPWTSAYTKRYGPVTTTDPNFGVELYTKEWEAVYGSDGRCLNTAWHIQYHNYIVVDENGNMVPGSPFPHIREETLTETFEYNTITNAGVKLTGKTTEKFVTDFTSIYAWIPATATAAGYLQYRGQKYVQQITKRTETIWQYPPELSDVTLSPAAQAQLRRIGAISEEAVNMEANEKDLIIPAGSTTPTRAFAPLEVTSKQGFRYIQTGNQLLRVALNEVHDPARSGPEVVREEEVSELAAGELPTSEVGTTIPFEQRSREVQISCGLDTEREKITLSYVGDAPSACRIRDQLTDARNSWKVVGNFTLLPDLNIREGMTMTITNAPARWQTSTFFVVGRTFERTTVGLIMRVTGLAWL